MINERDSMTVTEMEYKVLRAMVTNFFGNGPGTQLWSDCINDADEPSGIEGKQLSGVVASLSRKGLVETDGAGRDATVWLTKSGINLSAKDSK